MTTTLFAVLLALPQPAEGSASVRAASLLDLIVAEYDDAVSESGQVLSAAELQDQRAIARAVVAELRQLGVAPLVPQAEELASRIAAAGQPQAVVWRARKLQDEVVHRFQVALEPPRPPDLARGATLYQIA